MILDLKRKLKDGLLSDDVKLISQIEINEDEYIDLLNYVRNYIKKDICNIDKYIPIDESVSAFLVQVAIKRYSE